MCCSKNKPVFIGEFTVAAPMLGVSYTANMAVATSNTIAKADILLFKEKMSINMLHYACMDLNYRIRKGNMFKTKQWRKNEKSVGWDYVGSTGFIHHRVQHL